MQGYRKNVAMVVLNKNNQVLLCRRKGTENWQFPQGGIDENELCEDAMYRELYEEVGLKSTEVEILGKTREEIKEYINQTVDAAITERFPKTTGTVSTGLTKDKNGTTNP